MKVASTIGPKFFNDLLADTTVPGMDENGQGQRFAVHAFVSRGKKIADNLANRVSVFLQNCDKNPNFLKGNMDVAEGLVCQYSTLGELVERVEFVAIDFQRNLGSYNSDLDIQITGSFPVMNLEDASRMTTLLLNFQNMMMNTYIVAGTDLHNQMDRLYKLLGMN